jgi:ubiquitin C-terminal hydrolase
MGFGHYTACARDVLIDGTLSDAWTFYDDDDVRPVDDPADIKTPAAYMLFYKRRD